MLVDVIHLSSSVVGNSLLNGSEFVERRYCSNNFNSITQAFVVLFTLMVVDQWHGILHCKYHKIHQKLARELIVAHRNLTHSQLIKETVSIFIF